MPKERLNLDNIPIIDNHCHAGMLEAITGSTEAPSLHDMRDGSVDSKLQSFLSPEDYHKVKEALRLENEKKIEELDSRHGFKKIISDHAEFIARSNVFEILQEQAYQDIYGPIGSEEELSEKVKQQRKLGLAQSYIDIFARCGISMALTNIHKFDFNHWPQDRFRWLPHLDTFIFPFGGDHFLRKGGSTEDYGSYIFRHPEREMVQHLRYSGLSEIPQNFSDFLNWSHESITRLKNEDAAAMKLLMAYFRTLETHEVDADEAETSFQEGLKGKLDATRKFEDFMVRDLIRHCGELDFPVQIHVGQGGPGPGVLLDESRPELLHPIFEHPILRKTKIILLHGCFPYTQACGALCSQHTNVFIDVSAITMGSYYFLENQLVYWLENMPASKILFGSDAWTPEMFWVAVKSMKRALIKGLERMIDAGLYEIDEAMEIAKAILYRNSCKLYNLSI